MTAFSITPVGPFPQSDPEGFPEFIQWQAAGVDLGGPDADTVNISTGLGATRGVGEQANVITLTADVQAVQWQFDGVDLGPPDVDTVNLTDGLVAEQAGSTVTIRVTGSPPQTFIQWEQDGIPVGDDSVHHVNVLSPLVATRNSGLGTSQIVLAVVLPEWTWEGISLGEPERIIVGDNLLVSQPSGEGNAIRFDVALPVWEENGVGLGEPTKLVVGDNLAASVPSGEPNSLRIDATPPQWEDDGVSVGRPLRINAGAGISVSIPSGDPDAIELSATAPTALTWRDAAGDTRLATADSNKGIATTGTTGMQNIVIPDDSEMVCDAGTAVLVYQEGAAAVDFTPVSGVTLRYRSALSAISAGQYATVTLIKRRANEWLACGDLALAA